MEKLKLELHHKVAEIKEKDNIIRSLEDEYESNSEESNEEDDIGQNIIKDQHMLIGSGQFGTLFEVREGMEEEAKSLRKEWTSKLQRK